MAKCKAITGLAVKGLTGSHESLTYLLIFCECECNCRKVRIWPRGSDFCPTDQLQCCLWVLFYNLYMSLWWVMCGFFDTKLQSHRNKKLRDSTRCVKQPFKVTQGHPLLCQSTRHIWLPISTPRVGSGAVRIRPTPFPDWRSQKPYQIRV